MGRASGEVTSKVRNYEAQDLSNTSWAYARLAIVHYEMLDAIAADAVKKPALFTAQNLTNTAWAWASLVVIDRRLLPAISAEAMPRCSDFCAQNFGNTAWALAVRAVHAPPLLDAVYAAGLARTASYDLQALCWLADFNLACHAELEWRLEREVEQVWQLFPAASHVIGDAFLAALRQIRVDNLGAVGNRMLLRHMGVEQGDASLEERALVSIRAHRRLDPREDPSTTKFGGPTRHKRVFSYAEYRVRLAAAAPPALLEGALLQENGARGAHFAVTPLRAVPLPINQRVERSACSEFLLLSELCAALGEPGQCAEAEGTLRLWSTGPSCLSCMAALWQFRLRFPRLRVELGFAELQGQPDLF
eukprot:NODE_8127_length_1521_cov_3.482066.p1 GENE.NODE_8127_length_1521_cov_3.482066~~NODE_8127_length_1521_cov_3.482066.p1  ORF type:complete len:362 (+),score=130.43 NODE_8127_length_1521_cov_3.482066:412-1497(+)